MTPGDFLLVKFPFASLDAEKKRPALLLKSFFLSKHMRLFTVAMVISKIDGMQIDGDVLLKNWKQGGLLHPSLVRLSKMATLDEDIVERRLGCAAAPDLHAIKKAFRQLYREWL